MISLRGWMTGWVLSELKLSNRVFGSLEANKRGKNEKEIRVWEDLANGCRLLFYEVQWRHGRTYYH
jgi:hypothetical protein